MITFRIPENEAVTVKKDEPCRVTLFQLDGTTVEFLMVVANRQDARQNGMMYLTLFTQKEDN